MSVLALLVTKCLWRCEKHEAEYAYVFHHATVRQSAGCNACRKESGINGDRLADSLKKQVIWFEIKAEEKHGDRFRYIQYEKREGGHLYVLADCHKHGLFEMSGAAHLRAKTGGCPGCVKELASQTQCKVKDGKKICPKCGVQKPVGQFRMARGRYRQCKECKRASDEQYRKSWNDEQKSRMSDHFRRHGATYRILKAERIIDKIDASKVYERDKYRCYLCGVKVVPGAAPTNKKGATLDHLLPISKGGVESYSNVRTCCRSCNSSKHAKLIGQQVMQL